MATKLISLHGESGGGKGFVAICLEKKGYIHIRFSDVLREMLSSCFPIQLIDDISETPMDFLKNKSMRHCMRTLGTEWKNIYDHDLWMNIAVSKIKKAQENGFDVVVSDLRFTNEFYALHSLNSIFWYVSKIEKAEQKKFDFVEGNHQINFDKITDILIENTNKNNVKWNLTHEETKRSLIKDWWNGFMDTNYSNHESEKYLDIDYDGYFINSSEKEIKNTVNYFV